ncbi:MAG: TOBE domain-containing protein [Campylobacterales bacterium]|nr:TOBE domain-containing protein [Campylobacterales bacterium]
MNQLTATLHTVQAVDSLHQLTFRLGGQTLRLLSLELHGQIKIGNPYQLCVKSTDIALAKNLSGQLSYLNQINATVTAINNGALLSSVILDIEGFAMESVIPYSAVVSMDLQVDDRVVALMRGSEVSIFG